MSFTKDELQSFNTILEQKLTQQRRELERSFDQRLQVFKREIEQRLVFTQQDLVRVLSQHLSEQYRKLKEALNQRIDAQQTRIPSTVISEAELKQQLEEVVEHALDTQLISFDQLIGERFAPVEETPGAIEASPNFAEMELHTEIPLDDLADAVDKALAERFSALDTSLKVSITGIERYFATRLQTLREELIHNNLDHSHDTQVVESRQQFDGTITNMQDVFTSIERLERIIESMQVAMTSNHALLSNRMYHHQQLPLERAHPGNYDGQNSNTTTKSSLPLAKE